MRLFASDRVKNLMRSMGMEHGEAIEHRMVTNAIVKAQRKVEGRNFDIRKHLLEYDDVANDQRQVIYQQRNDLLEDADISDVITNVREDVMDQYISNYIPPHEYRRAVGYCRSRESAKPTNSPLQCLYSNGWTKTPVSTKRHVRARIIESVQASYVSRYAHVGDQMREVERQIMLQVLDNLWKEHLASMDQLRQGIGLRAYAQKEPQAGIQARIICPV